MAGSGLAPAPRTHSPPHPRLRPHSGPDLGPGLGLGLTLELGRGQYWQDILAHTPLLLPGSGEARRTGWTGRLQTAVTGTSWFMKESNGLSNYKQGEGNRGCNAGR